MSSQVEKCFPLILEVVGLILHYYSNILLFYSQCID